MHPQGSTVQCSNPNNKGQPQKDYKILIQEANESIKPVVEKVNIFLSSQGIICLVWNLNIAS